MNKQVPDLESFVKREILLPLSKLDKATPAERARLVEERLSVFAEHEVIDKYIPLDITETYAHYAVQKDGYQITFLVALSF